MVEGVSISRVADFPKEPGFYLVYSDARIGWLNWNPAAGVAYVGKADDGLRRRIEKEHNGDTGRSTLRRTLGAILKDNLGLIARPRPGRNEPKQINFTNYDFEPEGDQRLTDWIGEHLKVSVIVAKTEGHEKSLIAQHEPPLNLTDWRNPFAPEIKAARKACADEARRRYGGSI